jgi:N-acetyl-anhydromuramyl-L-alanine amidase AmpD
MSNSSLVSYTALSPNNSGRRNHTIDTISIHCMAGDLTVESCGALFAQTSRKASSNYGIGSDGRIALYVDEANCSWCTSSKSNDNRAITIEVANTVAEHPYPVSDAAYNSLIALLVDICRRNNIPELRWKADKSLIGQPDKQNMTVHRWFENKACPGEWLYSRHGQIAAEVNKILNEEDDTLTYEQFTEYMTRYLGEADSAEPSTWAKDSCDKAIEKGVVKGDGNGAYSFKRPLTREAYLVMQDRAGLL